MAELVTLTWACQISIEEKTNVINSLCRRYFQSRQKFFERLHLSMKLGEVEMVTKQALANGMVVIMGMKDNDAEELDYFLANGHILHKLAFSPTM